MIGQRSSVKTLFGLTEATLIRDGKCISREELEEVVKDLKDVYISGGYEAPVVEFYGLSVEEAEEFLAFMGW